MWSILSGGGASDVDERSVKNPCATYDSSPADATNAPVGRLLSDKRRRIYASWSLSMVVVESKARE